MKPPNDTLTLRFRELQALLEKEERFVLIEDLIGISGALFRIYWPAEEVREEGSDAPRAASVCSGDPVTRAAHAFQCSVQEESTGDGGNMSIGRIRNIVTLNDRIDFFVASLEEGIRLHLEGEYVESVRFLSGSAAYDGMIRHVEKIRQSGEEAEGSPGELAEVLAAVGECRLLLGRYLDRLGNFLDTGPALDPFGQEGKALLEAAIEYGREDGLNDKNRKRIAALLRKSQQHYARGFRMIQSLLEKQ